MVGSERGLGKTLLKKEKASELRERLQAVHTEQGDRLVGLGIHELVGLSAEDYRESIPRFPPPSVAYRSVGLVVPLVVDGRVSLLEYCDLLGISYPDNILAHISAVPEDNGIYTAWFNNPAGRQGSLLDALSDTDLRYSAKRGTLLELLALFAQYPPRSRSSSSWGKTFFAPGSALSATPSNGGMSFPFVRWTQDPVIGYCGNLVSGKKQLLFYGQEA